jgi:hypothetical protein
VEEKYKIHAFYILVILGAVIVGLVTVQWSSIPRLPEMLTFALTVSSLVLALLAIIYAYLSNSSFQQTTGALSRAADDVLRSAGEVRNATDRLGTQVADIPPMLTQMGERFEQTHAMLKEYSAKQNANVAAAPSLPPAAQFPDSLATPYLAISSVNGLMALLAFKLALKHRQVLDLTLIESRIGTGKVDDYMYGFLVASSASRVISYTGTGIKDVVPVQINQTVADGIEAGLVARISGMKTTDEHRQKNLQAMQIITQLFEPTLPTA